MRVLELARGEMVFPVRAAVVSTATGSFLFLIGFQAWAVILFGFLGFLIMGGLQFLKMVYRTFPRDLWCALYRYSLFSIIYYNLQDGL